MLLLRTLDEVYRMLTMLLVRRVAPSRRCDDL
jgi:hypothetical protein